VDKRLFFLINMAQHKLFKFVDSKSEELLGVSVTQVAAMLFIEKNEGCQQKELCAALGLNKPAVTGLANRMKKNGLLIRKACEEDGRASRLYLTASAKEKLPSVYPLLKEVNQALCEDFTKEEIEVVIRFLNRLMTRFD